jgi:hypothetical protein
MSEMAEPLEYASENYRFRRPLWRSAATLCIILAILGIVHLAIGVPLDRRFLIWWIASLTASAGATLWCLWHGVTSECWIEGDMLCWSDDESAKTTICIPLAEILQITAVAGDDDDDEGVKWCEIELRGRGRTRAESDALSTLLHPKGRSEERDRFKGAILKANPQVRFAQRKADRCHACGAGMKHFRERCPLCGAPVTARGRYVLSGPARQDDVPARTR